MSLLYQLQAALAEGTIKPAAGKAKAKAKAKGKGKKAKPSNGAKKYIHPGHRLAGERHGWKCPPPPKTIGLYTDKRQEHNGRFILPVLIGYLPEELEAAQYSPFAFLGTSPIWPNHLHLGA